MPSLSSFFPSLFETTNELNPLKGLTRLLTLVEVMKGGGENH